MLLLNTVADFLSKLEMVSPAIILLHQIYQYLAKMSTLRPCANPSRQLEMFVEWLVKQTGRYDDTKCITSS